MMVSRDTILPQKDSIYAGLYTYNKVEKNYFYLFLSFRTNTTVPITRKTIVAPRTTDRSRSGLKSTTLAYSGAPE